jgi:hypothetical protein
MSYNLYQNTYPNYQNPYTQQQQYQTQNNAFVSVRSIEEAYNWPVAPGNSITFKDENNSFVYTKTRGFSPLEQPTFEKYRLVKVEDTPQTAQNSPAQLSETEKQINLLWNEIRALKARIGGNDDKSDDAHAGSSIHAESTTGNTTNGNPG